MGSKNSSKTLGDYLETSIYISEIFLTHVPHRGTSSEQKRIFVQNVGVKSFPALYTGSL